MALDPTSREANVRDSVKKFFVDNLYRVEGVELTFDIGLTTPKIQGQNLDLDRWVAIQFGGIASDTMSAVELEIFCCSRNDPEGFKLAQLRDKVVGYLTDGAKPDGLRRITLYRSYADQPWESIGTMVVLLDADSPQLIGPDGTKFKEVPCRLVWGSKP